MIAFLSTRLFSGFFLFILLALLLHTGTRFHWLLIATFLLSLLAIMSVLKNKRFIYSPLHVFVGLTFFLLVLNYTWSVHATLSFVTFWALSLCLWAFFITPFCCHKMWENLWIMLLIVGFLGATWGAFEYFTNLNRVNGPQLDVNTFAAVLYVGSFLWLGQILSKEIKWHWRHGVGQFILLFAMMATFSRGGITAWLLGCIGFYAVAFRLRFSLGSLHRYILIAGCAYIVVKLLPLLLGQDVIARHFNDLSTLNARSPQWQVAWQLFLDNPFVGTGLGTFSVLYPSLRTEYVSAGKLAHNDYLQLMHEGGLLLAIFFILWAIWHGWCFYKALGVRPLQKNRQLHSELACMAGINLLLFAHACINFIFYIHYLNFVSGVIFARVSWLAWRLGFMGPLKTILLSWVTKCALVVVIAVLWVKLSLTGIPQLLFVDWKHKRWTDTEKIDSTIFEFLLTVDPTNTVISDLLIKRAYASLPAINPDKKQAMFDIAWSQITLLQRRMPESPKIYYWFGIFRERAEALALKTLDNSLTAADYYALSLAKHPGYFPTHLALSEQLTKQDGPKAALLYLRPIFWKWYRLNPVQETYHLLDTMTRLAQANDAIDVDRFIFMRDNLYQWINDKPNVFDSRYEG